jgi:hypothetical protein
MYKLILPVALVIFGFTLAGDKLTEKERNDAISYLKETQNGVAGEIKGLSENQLKWKPADSVWSAAECVEHIALSEKNIFDWAMSTLKENADPSKRSQLKFDDEAIKKMISDRGRRVKTREGFIPTGQFGNAVQTLAVFNERRDALINYVKTTEDDLRNHFGASPVGLMDTYQLLLFLAAHSKRHTSQIAELKSHPNFPKE